MELTRGVASAIPIAVVPFAQGENLPKMYRVSTSDLQMSGRFSVRSRRIKRIPQ